MYYTIYKITNLVNQKFYIGKHQTDDPNDDYMGSGKLLRRAQQKYGIENFKKEILYVFDNEDEMNFVEAELVTEEFCSRDDTYNLCPGGHGGWGYINSNTELRISKNKKAMRNANISMWKTSQRRNKHRKHLSKLHNEGKIKYDSFFGKKHTDRTKRLMSEKAKLRTGDKNSQFGTVWITDGVESRKIKKVDTVPEGWYRGRKI